MDLKNEISLLDMKLRCFRVYLLRFILFETESWTAANYLDKAECLLVMVLEKDTAHSLHSTLHTQRTTHLLNIEVYRLIMLPSVLGQNGSGQNGSKQNGTDKMVWIES